MFSKTLTSVLIIVVTGFIVCASVAKAQVVQKGLISYWTFDEADIDGDTVRDVWGNNHGIMVGEPRIVQGKVGEALEFDGEDDYVKVPHSEELDFQTDEATVEAWIYPNAIVADKHTLYRKAESNIDMLFGGKYNYNFCCTTFWQGRLLAKNRWNNIEYNGFYPIYDEDYTQLDLRSWQHVDEVLQCLESHDAVWFNFDGFVPNVGGDMGQQRVDFDAQKVYIRNVVARLAPYWNVTWNIAFEWQEFMSADEVQRLVDFTKQIDPWSHLVTVHDQGRYRTAKELIN